MHLVGYFYMNYTMMHGSTNVNLAVHWMAVDVAPDSLSTKHADIITTLHITDILTNETYKSKTTSCMIKEDIYDLSSNIQISLYSHIHRIQYFLFHIINS